jgi:hypothetical protein
VCSVYTHIAVKQSINFMVSEPLAERKPFCFFRHGGQILLGEIDSCSGDAGAPRVARKEEERRAM